MKQLLLIAVPISCIVAAPFRFDADEPKQSDSVKVAGLVLRWVRGDKEANFRRLEPMIREAAAKGARIVVTTECSLDGYAVADRKNISDADWRALGEPIPTGAYFKKLAALAKELKIFLVAGLTEADGDERYNTVVIIGPDGTLVGKYRKQKLGHEEGRNTPGTLSSVFTTPFGKVGVMICADRTDAKIVKRFCDNGADFLICPSGGMFGPKTNDPIVQARSKENKIHIVFVHPVEFLATGPDGGVLRRELLGNNLLVTKEQIGGKEDERRIYYFEMPVKALQDNGQSAKANAPTLALEVNKDAVVLKGKRSDIELREVKIPTLAERLDDNGEPYPAFRGGITGISGSGLGSRSGVVRSAVHFATITDKNSGKKMKFLVQLASTDGWINRSALGWDGDLILGVRAAGRMFDREQTNGNHRMTAVLHLALPGSDQVQFVFMSYDHLGKQLPAFGRRTFADYVEKLKAPPEQTQSHVTQRRRERLFSLRSPRLCVSRRFLLEDQIGVMLVPDNDPLAGRARNDDEVVVELDAAAAFLLVGVGAGERGRAVPDFDADERGAQDRHCRRWFRGADDRLLHGLLCFRPGEQNRAEHRRRQDPGHHEDQAFVDEHRITSEKGAMFATPDLKACKWNAGLGHRA